MSKVLINEIYRSNSSGEFIVLCKLPGYRSIVQFLKTGFTKNVRTNKVLTGEISDPLRRSVYGIGFFGIGKHVSSRNGVELNKYTAWSNMLERCYSESFHKNRPKYSDCFVCDEWLNYQNFADWYEENYIEGMHVEKDILIDGNRCYSPGTCSFKSCQENNEKAFSKNYKVISPHGEVFKVYNMNKFCRENGLTSSAMYNVANGKQRNHKGWSLDQNI